MTFEDGCSVTPGTVFNKIWRVSNSGTQAWLAGSQLLCVSGFGKTSPWNVAARYAIPEVAAGEVVNIIAENIVAPDTPGKFMSYYRFIGPDG